MFNVEQKGIITDMCALVLSQVKARSVQYDTADNPEWIAYEVIDLIETCAPCDIHANVAKAVLRKMPSCPIGTDIAVREYFGLAF